MMAQLRNMSIMARVNQEVPAQVLLSKPVVLLDARGRYAPFHLEFIESAEVYASSSRFRSSATYVAHAGFHRRPEDSVQRHRPTQNRFRGICT